MAVKKTLQAPACGFKHIHPEALQKAQSHMPAADTLRDLADLFKLFADVTRVRILHALFRSEMCVCDIAQLLGMGQSAISHQLRLLKQSKLVKNRREGQTVFYSLADEHVKTVFKQALAHVEE